ncbi:MAG: hypothetical protein LBR61_00955 [Synergistaceae bacterium]|nr:hypothetical protein [Synergistaceae bacterium]
MENIPLERFFTKKTPPPPETPDRGLSWTVRVPMLTNPAFMLDFLMAFLAAWFFPSLLFGLGMWASGVGRDVIFFVIRWIGLCVAGLAMLSCFFMLIRHKNGYYVRYTLSPAGISSTVSFEAPPTIPAPADVLFSRCAVPLSTGNANFSGTEKWSAWDKIRKVRVLRSLRLVTLSDSLLPVFRIFCPDDTTLDRVLELSAAMLARKKESAPPPA